VRAFLAFRAQVADSTELQEVPLAEAIAIATQLLSQTRKWRPATTLTDLNLLAAFLSRREQYAPMAPVSWEKVPSSSTIRDCRRFWTKKVQQDLLRHRPTATTAMVANALQSLSPVLRVVLVLYWATAARPSNVLRLRKSSFSATLNEVLWTDAKTTLARGPYSTPLQLGPHHDLVSNFLLQTPTDALFPEDMHLSALRRINTSLNGIDLRGLRRGALTTFARQGLTVDQLMIMSGHTSARSLWDFGPRRQLSPRSKP